MIRLSGKAYAVAKEEQVKWRDKIFEEQPYLANVYSGDIRSIGIIFCIDRAQVEYFNLGVNLYIWQGDITRLQTGAIVNAANSGMTGCYQPCHNCIDNCIHTYAGIQLRNYCNDLMQKQGKEEPTGQRLHRPMP